MIKGSLVNFRNVTKKDLSLLRDWRNSKKLFEFSWQFRLFNMVDQESWFKQLINKNSDKTMFIITTTKKNPIGICGLTELDIKNKSTNAAIMIGDTDRHGKGYGSESLKILVKYGFTELGLHRIEAEIFEFNHISIRLFEKINFKHESTLRDSLWRHGRWWNTNIYSILENEFID